MKKIIEIEEVGYPNCLIMREGVPISELIKTEDLVSELFDLYASYDDAYNHACEYQQRAHDAEQACRDMDRGYLKLGLHG